MQLLLTFTTSKGFEINQVTVLTSPEDIHLKFLCEISSWLINDWCPHSVNLPISKDVPLDDNTTSIEIEEHAEPLENILESHDDSKVYFYEK